MRRHNSDGNTVIEGKYHEAEWDDHDTQQVHLSSPNTPFRF
jgi:hypothetical protein